MDLLSMRDYEARDPRPAWKRLLVMALGGTIVDHLTKPATMHPNTGEPNVMQDLDGK